MEGQGEREGSKASELLSDPLNCSLNATLFRSLEMRIQSLLKMRNRQECFLRHPTASIPSSSQRLGSASRQQPKWAHADRPSLRFLPVTEYPKWLMILTVADLNFEFDLVKAAMSAFGEVGEAFGSS